MKWIVLGLFLATVTVVHFRGRVKFSYWRQIIDHSALMAPINVFLYTFSKIPAKPFFSPDNFPELAVVTSQWEAIREEALKLQEHHHIQAAQKNDDAGFNSFFKTGWKRFYLKWYGASHPSAQTLCPKTVALLQSIPSVKAAMFAELPPGAILNPHRDPYGGSIRYHLGLITPNDDRCYIEVDGERYSWRDGQCVFFDETFIHEAHNPTDKNRIILFCDVERPMRYKWAQAVNRFLGNTLITAASSPNKEGDETGVINRLFGYVWLIGQYRRKLKNWNRTVYKLTKIALLIAVISLILWL
jgi:beta-hydroxylase